MTRWQYDKVDLNDLPRKTTVKDLLNELGDEGWELVLVTANNFAILKRPIVEARPTRKKSASENIPSR
jgi:hypothetical protein